MAIGRVVKSNSHVDYVCRVFDAADVSPAPSPADYPFGGFVSLDRAVGVIYRSELVNPDYGHQGPRLAVADPVRAVVTPDLINEQATFVGLLLIGERRDGEWVQGVPKHVVPVHTDVEGLNDEAVLAFHRSGGVLQLKYYPLLLSQAGSMGPALLLALIDRLDPLVTAAERSLLAVLRTTVSWQATLA